ncbi:MAG: electron transfer flavoprotein subunit alpha/FixB family protein [Ruminococcus sp.]|nr:electron transfer flavoprotein subunit alpha/FixB family protein [Ruminococcus sp.]
MISNNSILVVCGLNVNSDEHTMQIISKASELSHQTKKQVLLAVAGNYDELRFRAFTDCGADCIIFWEYTKSIGIMKYSSFISAVIREYSPEIVLFPATESIKSVAAIISSCFEAGLTADCIDIICDEDNKFHFYRAAVSNSVIAKIVGINSSLSMGTVKEGEFKKKTYSKNDENDNFQIMFYHMNTDEIDKDYLDDIVDIKYREKVEEKTNINNYSIVFCIGRGAEESQTIEKIYRLAEAYNACVVGTKAVIDDNILDKAFQVGQSGKSISPSIYIGLGVSGANQHIVGMKNSQLIIAVNHDADAPIMKYADYAIIDDVNVFLDKMLDMLVSYQSE